MLKNAFGAGLQWLKSSIRSRRESEADSVAEMVRVVEQRMDADWYLARYPDVARSGQSPALHYVLTGAGMGYDPAPEFSTFRYIEAYPDVKTSSQNPYFHWLRYGRAEGRPGFGEAMADTAGDGTAAGAGRASVMFTICIFCGNSPDDLVRASVESVIRQTYRNFELVLVGRDRWDVPQDPRLPSRGIFHELLSDEADFFLSAGAERLRGDYVMALQPGDRLVAHALSALSRSTEIGSADERADVLVFDYMFGDQQERCRLPGLDPELLAFADYLQSACAVSRELLGRSRDWGTFPDLRHLLLAAAERGVIFRHVAQTLMHAAEGPAFPPFQVPGKSTADGVSIIIPNRNRPDLLRTCTGFLARLGVPFQLIIVDNGSSDPAVEDIYTSLQEEHDAKVLRVSHDFNYSRMINLAVRSADFEFLLLLNNDVVIGDVAAVELALGYAARQAVGVVGSVLRYPDGGVQHAGMVFWTDPDGTPRSDHVLRHAKDDESHCLGALSAPRCWQAVTGAFQVLRKSVFDAAGGYDDCNLPVEYNDVDFCFRVRSLGWRVVCLPLPGITHDESSTRKSIESPKVHSMVKTAQAVMRARWTRDFSDDPFFHPELKRELGLESRNSEGSAAAWHSVGMSHSLHSPAPRCAEHPAPTSRKVLNGLTERVAWFPRRLSSGLSIAGYLNSEIGLGEAARNLGRASDTARIPTTYVNRPLMQRSNDPRYETFFQPHPDRAATISIEGLTLDGYGFKDTGHGRIQILYPFWELPHIPRGAYAMLDRFDELWAASEFIADALREANRKPVRLIPQSMFVPESLPASSPAREKLQFLTFFDYDSYIARKNPLAAVAAFRAAFPERSDVELVVKARGLDGGDARQRVAEAVGADRRIRLIDATMSREQMNTLMSETDVFISLHRSEGFGFGAAEALAAGKAVVATGWSATNDFVTAETGFLVDYRLRPVKKNEYVYTEGQVWAEPDADAAIEQLRRIADDPHAAAARAQKGHALLLRRNSFAAVGAEIARSLKELGAV